MTLPPLPTNPTDEDWRYLGMAYPWLDALRGVPQRQEYHGEGDVFTHTRLVVEALLDSREWQELPAPERAIVHWAALLHDVAKPRATRLEADGVTARGHARSGALLARRILWSLGAGFAAREHVVALVGAHQLPFWALERDRPERRPILLSHSLRCDLLALLAEADARGRICRDQSEILDGVELFRDLCREWSCFEAPYPFASAPARFEYFRKEGRHPSYAAFDETLFEVTLMSGLPGAGKDTWLRAHAPELEVVSLDALRHELEVRADEDQGAVIDAARARARELLRKKRPFAWNATNLSRMLRGPLIDLCADYGARVRIVYAEAREAELLRRNAERAAAVPAAAIAAMLERWEVPSVCECHELVVAL